MNEFKGMAAFESAPDAHVFLITGELPAEAGAPAQLAVGYVIAESAEQAAAAQMKASPQLRLGGAVSLAQLKEQVAQLEAARAGGKPALLVGPYAQEMQTRAGNALR